MEPQNLAFFKKIQDVGITPKNGYYVMSYSIAEEEVEVIANLIRKDTLADHYVAWNYLMSIDTPNSRKFVRNFKKRWGRDRVVGDPHESAYNMVYLWKAAVEKAGTFNDNFVREALVGIELNAPQGPVKVMQNHHLSQTVRIGQITANAKIDVVASTEGPIDPQAWNQFAPSSRGYACDWTSPHKGEKYRF